MIENEWTRQIKDLQGEVARLYRLTLEKDKRIVELEARLEPIREVWEKYRTKVVQVDRFYPSSKLVACCGMKIEYLSLSVREVTCPLCGKTSDRDLNAAINIHREGQRTNTASCAGINACGEVGSEPLRKYRLKPTSMKQESMVA